MSSELLDDRLLTDQTRGADAEAPAKGETSSSEVHGACAQLSWCESTLYWLYAVDELASSACNMASYLDSTITAANV